MARRQERERLQFGGAVHLHDRRPGADHLARLLEAGGDDAVARREERRVGELPLRDRELRLGLRNLLAGEEQRGLGDGGVRLGGFARGVGALALVVRDAALGMEPGEAFGVAHRLARDGARLGDVGLGDGDLRAGGGGGLAGDDDLVGDRGGVDLEEHGLAGLHLVAEIHADAQQRPGDAGGDDGGVDRLKRPLHGRGALEHRVRRGQRADGQRLVGKRRRLLAGLLCAAGEKESEE